MSESKMRQQRYDDELGKLLYFALKDQVDDEWEQFDGKKHFIKTAKTFVASFTKLAPQKTNCGLTYDELIAACANVGINLNCGQCASVFFTGSGTYEHDHGCQWSRLPSSEDRAAWLLHPVSSIGRDNINFAQYEELRLLARSYRDTLLEAQQWGKDGDKPLPDDAAIEAAHPIRTKRHDLWIEAMRLVGARHSKGGLVELVNWLLYRILNRHSNHSDDLIRLAEAYDAAAEDRQRAVTAERVAETLRDAIDAANSALFLVHSDAKDVEHQISSHAGTLPELVRSLSSAALKAYAVLNVAIDADIAAKDLGEARKAR